MWWFFLCLFIWWYGAMGGAIGALWIKGNWGQELKRWTPLIVAAWPAFLAFAFYMAWREDSTDLAPTAADHAK
jgi:hypothetical protein